MQRTLKNTLSVLLVTGFTALSVFGTVQLTGRLVGGTTVASTPLVAVSSTSSGTSSGSSSSSGLLVCPRTGCTAQSCHAAR